MKQFPFPRSRILLPDTRRSLTRSYHNKAVEQTAGHIDEQQLQTFQLLLEESLLQGTPLRLVTSAAAGPGCTTGIVTTIDAAAGKITLRTLEGDRVVRAGQIQDIQAF